MPEKTAAENLLNNLVETIAESSGKHKSVSFFEEEKSDSVTSQFKRLFGRQKPVHHLLGGGKCRTILLFSCTIINLLSLTFSSLFLLESCSC